MINKIIISKTPKKDLKKVPEYILEKFIFWVSQVERFGIEKTRTQKSLHDEPLKGERFGQRSVRLNKTYRAIYKIENEVVEFIEVIEVNKHDY